MAEFQEAIRRAYTFSGASLEIGHAIRDGTLFPDLPIRVPLSMMNRHGLIAGSTGTGKTRTLQLLTESLSRSGVPTFVSDVKGDLSGMARPGEATPKVLERMKNAGREFKPESFPVELFSLTGTRGIQIRATLSSFGPLLLAKVLDLTEVQRSVLALVFKYCDDRRLPLLDLKDLREVLGYLQEDGKADAKQYGGMSGATVGVLFRKMVELEQQGAERFFGEPQLDINELMRISGDGRGVVNILSLSDVQDRPRLYSTFLMWLLGQFYHHLPEVGDLAKPKLVFFFDEAHLLFDDASSALVEHIEQVARLIRSKGIGVFFVTHTPKDIDDEVLAQLGNRIQHAVRAFTPADAKNLRATASTYPTSTFYDIEKTLTSVGIGEALVTVLGEKGAPTEPCVTQILAPSSFMGTLTDEQARGVLASSPLAAKYATAIDRESAYEILQRRIDETAEESPALRDIQGRRRTTRREKGVVEEVLTSTAGRQAVRTVTREVVRGLFGLLKRRR